MRRAGLFGLSMLLLRAALAQTQPDVAEILKNVSATYKTASQYEFVEDATYVEARSGTHGVFHMLFCVQGAKQVPNGANDGRHEQWRPGFWRNSQCS